MQYALCNINMHYYQHTVMMFFNIIDRWGMICGLQNQNMKRGKYCYQHTIQSFFKLSSDDQTYFKQMQTIFLLHTQELFEWLSASLRKIIEHWEWIFVICKITTYQLLIHTDLKWFHIFAAKWPPIMQQSCVHVPPIIQQESNWRGGRLVGNLLITVTNGENSIKLDEAKLPACSPKMPTSAAQLLKFT